MTRPPGTVEPDSRGAVPARFLRILMPYVSAACLAAAPLYAFDARPLPDPRIALVVVVAIAAVAATWDTAVRTGRATSRTQPPVGPVTAPTSPSFPPTAQPAERRLIDPSTYEAARRPEAQCPHCGGFDVRPPATESSDPWATCGTCGFSWSLDSAPDVVVRSWLHRQGAR